MGKCDVHNAYRNVPIHPRDTSWLGLQWDEVVYVDTVLPFGLRSAPKIFTAVADAFHWVVLQAGMEYMFHYVDDFITIASTNKKCQEAMQTVHTVGIRTRSTDGAQEDGGSGTFFGVEIDTVAMEAWLPQEKLAELVSLLEKWLGRKHCIKEDLESLTGKHPHKS